MDEKEYLVMDDTGNEAVIEYTPEMDMVVTEYLKKLEDEGDKVV